MFRGKIDLEKNSLFHQALSNICQIVLENKRERVS